MKDSLAMGQPEGRPAEYRTSWQMLFVLGLGLALVGMVDAAVLFVPANWSSLDWEFGTVGGLIEGLPLITMGMGFMAASSTAAGWVWTKRMVVMALVVLVLGVGLALVAFSLDVPAVLRAAAPALHQSLKKVAVKTALMGLVHVALYVLLLVWVWRARNATR